MIKQQGFALILSVLLAALLIIVLFVWRFAGSWRALPSQEEPDSRQLWDIDALQEQINDNNANIKNNLE